MMTTHLFKIIFHDTRPCFENQELGADGCSCEFGNPSGHSSESVVMYFWICYEFIYKQRFNHAKILSMIVFIACCLITGLGRIYYGVHFFDQIILGYLIGYFCLSVHFILKYFKVSEIIINID